MPREAVGITMPASHVMSLDIFAIDRTMIAGQRGEGLGHEAPYPRSERLWAVPGHSWDIHGFLRMKLTIPTTATTKSLLVLMLLFTPPIDHRPSTMPTLQGHTRTAFLCFFASHIPITLLLDSQAVFPRHYYPQIVRDAVDWYSITFKVHFI
jgi:hypothetical protein